MQRLLVPLLACALIAGVALSVMPATAVAATVDTWTCSVGDASSGCAATTIAAMPTARSAIGLTANSSDSRIYAVDGQTGSSTTTGATQSYSPSGNTWTTGTADGTTRAGPGAMSTSGQIYSLGGVSSQAAEYYSATNHNWTTLSQMPTARGYLGGVIGSDGNLYAIGGLTGTTYLNTVQYFTSGTGQWFCSTSVSGCTNTSTPPIAMPTARARVAAVEDANGLIYVIGGQTASSTYTSVVEAYNPTTRTWTCSTGDSETGCSSKTLTPMPTARAAQAATTSNGLIYVMGGSTGSASKVVEVYNATTNQWACSTGDASSGCTSSTLAAVPTARSDSGTAMGSDGQIYVVGGLTGSTYLSTVEAFDPPTTPSSPTGVSATAGDSMASVSWTAPSSTGGMAISGYTVSCSPSCTPVTVSGSTTTATVTGLTNGTAYTFTVTPTNFVGSGTGATASATPTCTPAAPSISGGSPGTFSATLNGSNQSVYAAMNSYTGQYEGCSGWNVTFQATQMQSGTGDTFPAGSITMPPPAVSACLSFCGAGSKSTAPKICQTGNVSLDTGTAVTIASAPASTGEGSYLFTPGTIGTGNLQLSVPSYAYATSYSSTLTVSIIQGPASSC